MGGAESALTDHCGRLTSVHGAAGFHARQVYWTRDELLAWFQGDLTQNDGEQIFSEMHKRDRQRWEVWKDRTRRSYNIGVIVLLLGVAVTLASGFAFAEIIWWSRNNANEFIKKTGGRKP